MKTLTDNKQKAQKLTKQTQGTLTKVAEMIENDKYCIEVIQQIDSVIGMMQKVKLELLAGHFDHCLESKLKENKKSTIEELLKIYKLSS